MESMFNLTTDNIYSLTVCLIGAVLLIIFGMVNKRYITYKRIRFEITHDLDFTEKFWGKTGYEDEKGSENAKNILSQDSQKLLNYIENLPKSSLMRIGVPQSDCLTDIAIRLMYICQSINEEGMSEEQCSKNKAEVEEIRNKFGIKK